MESRERKIYWREEEQSYLPKFNSLFLENFFRMEMSLFIQKLREGKVLTYGEYWDRFRDPNAPGKIKPEAKDFMMDHQLFGAMNQKVTDLFGIWLENFSAHNCLTTEKYYKKNFVLAISENDLDDVVKLLCDGFKNVRTQTDDFLKQMNQESLPSHLKSDADVLKYCGEKVLRNEIAQLSGDFDEMWFDYLPIKTCIYLESIGYCLDKSVVWDAALNHFESWCEPVEKEITKYLDEMKGIVIQKIFTGQYGKS